LIKHIGNNKEARLKRTNALTPSDFPTRRTMSNSNGNNVLLQARAAFTTPMQTDGSPIEGFIDNRIEAFMAALETSPNPAAVLRDVYLAGLFDSRLTIAEVAYVA
jgi:hypothetical protein